MNTEDRYLVLINPTATQNTYRFHEGWFPRYLKAQLVFWSDGQKKEWKDETSANKRISNEVLVPGYAMVLLRQKKI